MSGNIIVQVSKFQNHLEEEDIKNILESEQDEIRNCDTCARKLSCNHYTASDCAIESLWTDNLDETISYDDYEWE
jgi:hypothetical protein